MSQPLDIYDYYFRAYGRQILQVVRPSVITVILNSFALKLVRFYPPMNSDHYSYLELSRLLAQITNKHKRHVSYIMRK